MVPLALVIFALLVPATAFNLTFKSNSRLDLVGNVSAIEGGVVLKLEDSYGLFTTDITKGIVNTRLVWFKADNKSGPFVYQGELACCSSGNTSGFDNRASLWVSSS
eukprot:m.40504 g.40504  ORF g.40504 m.40504 type:complete len:106 (+) comp9668_c0_seq1:188-505(+)